MSVICAGNHGGLRDFTEATFRHMFVITAHALYILNVSGPMVRLNDLSIIFFFAGCSNWSGRKHFTRFGKIDSELAYKPLILASDACVGLFG